VGTFVTRTLADQSLGAHESLRQELSAWLDKARAAGLDEESIEALIATTVRTPTEEST
jgi:GntR family transcriptional regulator